MEHSGFKEHAGDRFFGKTAVSQLPRNKPADAAFDCFTCGNSGRLQRQKRPAADGGWGMHDESPDYVFMTALGYVVTVRAPANLACPLSSMRLLFRWLFSKLKLFRDKMFLSPRTFRPVIK